MRRLGSQRWFAEVGSRVAPKVDRFVDAVTGGRFQAAQLFIPTLMLTTRGHRSGQRRTVPLLYVRHGDSYAVVGSNWGGEDHPAWTANLLHEPRAVVTVEGERQPVHARLVEDEGLRDELWRGFDAAWPAYATYRERASHRGIRMFLLDPVG